MRYLLDTNILSDVIRNPQGTIAARIREVGEPAVCTSIIVAAELRYGALKRGSERLTQRVDAILEAIEVLSLDPPADAVYGRLRAELERSGQSIGGNDLLIAAQCVAQKLTLVTNNEREFGRIGTLSCENWLRPTA